MRFFFCDQSAKLAPFLDKLRGTTFSSPAIDGLPETRLEKQVPTTRADLRACDLDFLFRYDVFPPDILQFLAEWELDGRQMRIGDTIVQQVQTPPGWGFHLLFAVRVINVFRGEDRAGFSYRTLRGHPETGTNEFSFASASGGITAMVRTTAAPGLAISRLLAPIVTRPYVAFCNRRALDQMVANFLMANP